MRDFHASGASSLAAGRTQTASGLIELSPLLMSKLNMRPWLGSCLVAALALAAGCRVGNVNPSLSQADGPGSTRPMAASMRGVHLILGSDSQAAALKQQMPKLAAV